MHHLLTLIQKNQYNNSKKIKILTSTTMKFDILSVNEAFIANLNKVFDSYVDDDSDDKPDFFYKLEGQDYEEEDESEDEHKEDNLSLLLNAMHNGDTDVDLNMPTDKKKSKKPKVFITLHNKELITEISKILMDTELQSEDPCISIQSLYWSINDLRIKNNDTLAKFVKFTEELFHSRYSTMDKMISNNMISFDALWYHFDKVNTLYTFKHHDFPIAMRHQSFTYTENYKNEYINFILNGHVITVNSGEQTVEECEFEIKKFKDTKPLSSFKVSVVTAEEKEKLNELADKTMSLRKDFHHMYLDGSMYIKYKESYIKRRKCERVMVDQKGHHDLVSNEREFVEVDPLDSVEDEYKCTVYPFLHSYNLGIDKFWGLSHCSELNTFEYQANAFDCLVLDKEKKHIIKAMINNRNMEFDDFISDKGNNTIFLLSGPPGVGKSLTAEATSEYLNLPLYRINVGDLGTNSERMESILSDIFKLTERWGAIILVDEVDIFLEERCDFNIVHNAMVSTFMKVLDYNNSIIFLTTNRLTNIDSAVKSRINLLLNYKVMPRKDKKDVWSKLLTKWEIGLTKDTITELARYDINGREIRNFIKTVMSIHKEDKTDVTDESFLKCMKNIHEITNDYDQHNSKPSTLYN
jgi:hypothetical protein